MSLALPGLWGLASAVAAGSGPGMSSATGGLVTEAQTTLPGCSSLAGKLAVGALVLQPVWGPAQEWAPCSEGTLCAQSCGAREERG